MLNSNGIMIDLKIWISLKERLKKEDLFDRNHKFEVIDVDASFPRYIYKNKEKFKDFIYSD